MNNGVSWSPQQPAGRWAIDNAYRNRFKAGQQQYIRHCMVEARPTKSSEQRDHARALLDGNLHGQFSVGFVLLNGRLDKLAALLPQLLLHPGIERIEISHYCSRNASIAQCLRCPTIRRDDVVCLSNNCINRLPRSHTASSKNDDMHIDPPFGVFRRSANLSRPALTLVSFALKDGNL